MTCPQLGLIDEIAQGAVHLAAPGRTDHGIDAAGEQRMGELDPFALDLNDAVALGHFEKVDDALGTLAGDPGQEVDRRRTEAGGRQQHRQSFVAELVQAGAHQVGQ